VTAGTGLAVVATIVNAGLIARAVTRGDVPRWAVVLGLATAVLAVGLLVLSVQPLFGDHPTVAERRWSLLAIAATVATSTGAACASRLQREGRVGPIVAAMAAGALGAVVVAGLTLPEAVPG
jgi:drug/metabolite transporter (DMT)-like permease